MLGIDGVGVSHKPSGLLKARVNALDISVAQDVSVSIHLSSRFIVTELIVFTFIPIVLQPGSQIVEVDAAGGIGLGKRTHCEEHAHHPCDAWIKEGR